MAIQKSHYFTPMSPTNGSQLKTNRLQSHLHNSKQSLISHYFSKRSGASTASAVGMDKETPMKPVMQMMCSDFA